MSSTVIKDAESLAQRNHRISLADIFLSAIIIAFIIIAIFIANSNWISSNDFHASMEIVGSMVAILSGIACVVYYHGLYNLHFFILGLGFFYVGSEHFVHGFAAFERFMGSNINLDTYSPLTNITGRLILASSIILACVWENNKNSRNLSKLEIGLYCTEAAVCAGIITYMVAELEVSGLINTDRFLAQRIDSLTAIYFLVSLLFVYRAYRMKKDIFSTALMACVMFQFCSQIFMSLSKVVYDGAFDMAHLANFLSYLMPVFGIVILILKQMEHTSGELEERKEILEALERSEKKLREITDNMLDFMWRVDKDGNMTYVSTSFCSVIGKNYKELKGSSLTKYVHHDDLNIVEEFYKFNDLKSSGRKVEYRLKTMDESFIWIESVGNLIFDEEGAISGAVFTARDITERKLMEELQRRIEEERKALNEVREYDKIKTEFFANISHELRTPINVIFSALQVLDLHITGCPYGVSDTNANKYSKVMKQNCYRLLRLVNNLIDITKIDYGYFEINRKNYNIVSLVEEITLSVAGYAEGKGLVLIFDTDVEEKIIACDPDKIERIIMNLLSNAVKFTGEGGNIMVTLNDLGDSIRISVKDDGRGIPKEKIGSIFERFIQVDKSLTRDHEGSGIGLSLVKSLIEMHGGTISVDSKIGQGTEFLIVLPCEIIDETEIKQIGQLLPGYIERINIEFSDIYN